MADILIIEIGMTEKIHSRYWEHYIHTKLLSGPSATGECLKNLQVWTAHRTIGDERMKNLADDDLRFCATRMKEWQRRRTGPCPQPLLEIQGICHLPA